MAISNVHPSCWQSSDDGRLRPFTSGTTASPMLGTKDRSRRGAILLVDDDESLLFLTRVLLELEGYRVVSCSSPRHAIEQFTDQDPVDLLLTDYQMPHLTGIELARQLTALRPELAVLMVSGSILSEAIEAEMQANRWRFIAKPCRNEKLSSCVRSLLA